MNLVRIIIIALLVLLLHACASSHGMRAKFFPSNGLSLAQCQSLELDPYQTGLQDGKSGKDQTIDTISKDCDAHHINIDTQSYIAGWRQGLQLFCLPSTTFDVGVQGKDFPTICQPLENVGELQAAYNRGQDIFVQIRPINDRIEAIDEQIKETNRIKNDITQTETRISHLRTNDPMGPTTQQRQELQLLRSRLNNLNADLHANTIGMQTSGADDLSIIKENLITERENLIEALKSESQSSTP